MIAILHVLFALVIFVMEIVNFQCCQPAVKCLEKCFHNGLASDYVHISSGAER